MASPSRSGSVATKISVASLAAFFSSAMTFLREGIDLVVGAETLLDVDTQLALGQVPDVTHRRDDLEVASQVFVDGLRLCGRLDHDERFAAYLEPTLASFRKPHEPPSFAADHFAGHFQLQEAGRSAGAGIPVNASRSSRA